MSDATSALLQLLSQAISVDVATQALLRQAFEPVVLPKSTPMVKLGAPAQYMFFLTKGFARAYHLQDGEEITNHLTGPGKFITAYTSFVTGAPSDEAVQAVTASEGLRVTKAALDDLYRRSHPMALFGLLMADRYLLFNNQRGKDLITLSARERYLKLLDEDPALVQHVPLQYVASYLGVKPESLSRIRRQLLS